MHVRKITILMDDVWHLPNLFVYIIFLITHICSISKEIDIEIGVQQCTLNDNQLFYIHILFIFSTI